jgi:hypothetical protein
MPYQKKRNNNRFNNNKNRNNNNNNRFNNNKNRNNNNNNYNRNTNNYYNNKKHNLNTKWVVWIHDIKETSWTQDSYKKIYEIHTIEDFWTFFNNVRDYKNHLFFVMRGDTKPFYEDKANINGGSWSFSIYYKDVQETLIHTLVRMIGETLTKETMDITGLSMVPKRGSYILKVWLKNKEKEYVLDTQNIYGLKSGRFQAHKF